MTVKAAGFQENIQQIVIEESPSWNVDVVLRVKSCADGSCEISGPPGVVIETTGSTAIQEMGRVHSLSGQVVSASGKPLAHVRVDLLREDWPNGLGTAETDAEGIFAFDCPYGREQILQFYLGGFNIKRAHAFIDRQSSKTIVVKLGPAK
jgi:hypothetical protein